MALTTQLVGRDADLAELDGLLAEASGGHQRVALVCGDPGIGKTALVEALAERARQAGFQAIWGRCWEGGASIPYWPWVQVARTALDGDDAGLLAGGGTVSSSVDEDRSRLFDALTQRLVEVARRGGLLVALDDLHAADEGSLQLLRFVARLGAPVPLLVVGTYRVAEVARSAPHQLALSAVARHGPTIRLRGLQAGEVEALLVQAGSGSDRAQARAGDVHRITDGNPFLVYEAARLIGTRPDVALPAEARAVVHARLDPLPPDLRRLLVAGAVVGREFSLALLSRLVDQPPDDLLNRLAEAQELLVLDEVALGRWSFSHSLLREALLDGLDEDERRELHGKAGSVLEELDPTDPAVLPEIAHHFAEGDDPRASDACERAGDAAAAAYAFEDAARWYRRALDHTPEHDEWRRYDLLLALGGALLKTGDEVGARDVHHRAIRTARSLGSVERAAEAAIRIAPISLSDATVIGALDDALCDLPEDDSALRARVLVAFATVLRHSTVHADVLADVSRQGRDMARRVGDPETLWSVLWQWHKDAYGRTAGRDGGLSSLAASEPSPPGGILDERLGVAEELLAMAEQTGDEDRVVLARQARADALFEAGRFDEARADAEACLEAATRRLQPRSQLSALVLLGRIALDEGRHRHVEELAQEVAALGLHCEGPDGEVAYYELLMPLRQHQGRFEEVERLGREAVERWTSTGLDCFRQLPRIVALAELGRREEAAELIDQLVGDQTVELTFGRVLPGVGWVPDPRACCPSGLAEACCLLDDERRVAELYEPLLPWAALPIFRGTRGVVARYLGLMAAALGRYDEADAHFQLAHRLHDQLPVRVWRGRTRLEHGQMLLRRDGPGDRQRAAELLAEARDIFDALDITVFRERAAELLEQARRTSSRASLREEDGHWTFTYGGSEARLRDSKGVRFLARLLREPGREFHAVDLSHDGLSPVPADAAEYRARLAELQDELDEAAAHHDLERVERARDGIDRFIEQVEKAAGRGSPEETERARQSVSRALKGAVDRLAEAHPALGDHLRSALRIGVYSSYVPDPRAPTVWQG